MQFWCSLILKLHQKCIKTPWNYIKSASKWCSFKTASKLHQECIIIFGHFYIFFLKFCWKSSKNMMHFWCSFGAVLKPHQKCIKTLWNYIKSASKWCSFKIASKLHQKCIIFLEVSTFFLQKWVHAQVVKSFFENRKIDVAQTDHSRSVEGLHR